MRSRELFGERSFQKSARAIGPACGCGHFNPCSLLSSSSGSFILLHVTGGCNYHTADVLQRVCSTIMRTPVVQITFWFFVVLRANAFVREHQNEQHSALVSAATHADLCALPRKNKAVDLTTQLTHADIAWKLRLPPGTPAVKRLLTKLGANLIRLDAAVKKTEPPFCLCPKGGQAVLEAYYQAPYTTSPQKVGRFGITTISGPPASPINQSVEQIYGIQLDGRQVSSAAIIYMFVEDTFRQRGVGTLALQVISTIHGLQGCDFTLLVADDKGSGKLVHWYEQHGFTQAPLLQEMLGSPSQQYGVAMIAPTSVEIDPSCRIQWW